MKQLYVWILSLTVAISSCNKVNQSASHSSEPSSGEEPSTTEISLTDDQVASPEDFDGQAEKGRLLEAQIVEGNVLKPTEFTIELSRQTITADGNGHLHSREFDRNIDLGESFYTRKIHFLEAENSVILFFEITDDDGRFNDVYRLDLPALRTIWKTTLYSFNLTVGEAEGEIFYLGAGENAYALNMSTGKVIWQTSGLYHNHGFNHFIDIALTSNETRLTGQIHSRNGARYATAVLQKTDGRILSVE